MKTVIVFESMFGNTERFAREMARGLAGVGHRAALVDVRHVRSEDVQECDLLVVGAPTHAFSLSRPGTRQEAVAKGADPTHAAPGVREWLTTLDAGALSGHVRPVVAVFDSRVTKVRHLPGSAAHRAVRILRARGFEVLDDTRSFYVVDTTGPPAPGEATRARAWAAGLAAQVAARPSPVA